ncbi:hypothetical protein [Flavobacterium sp. JP2137]|uniref:hypothetical protein n=1 Tax=Flavobacterium sp. JP2137 TaxID=3414510 RepID=UPI003D2FE5DC
MYKNLMYLATVRFRKIFSKGDYMAMGLTLLAYALVAYVIFTNFEALKYYCVVFVLEVVLYHWNRTDMELLKLKRGYKGLLFLEYGFYTLPIYAVLLLKGEWLAALAVAVFIFGLISLPKRSFKTLRSPFRMTDPFWTMSFRKYKLFFALPFCVGGIYLAKRYENEQLILGVLLLITLLGCIPSFQREREEEVKRSVGDAKSYLRIQVYTQVIHIGFFLIPLALTLLLFSFWSWLYLLLLPLCAVVLNVILKYVFFHNPLLQQLFWVFFISLSMTTFGLPLIALPFLYQKAINNLRVLKPC